MNEAQFTQILDAMAEKPALYFGNRDGYLREVAAFIFGVDAVSGRTADRGFLPATFISHVCDQVADPQGKHPTWSGRIEGATLSEHDAWLLFVQLWRQYRANSQPA